MKRFTRILFLTVAFFAVSATAWFLSARESGATASRAPTSMHRFWPAPMPAYPMAQEMPMSDDMVMGQARMKMAWFRTADEPLKVSLYYEGIWESAGYYVTREVHPYGGKVAALDLKSNLLRQVVMTREGDQTSVYVSLIMGSPSQLMKGGATDTALPLMAGAEGVTQLGSRDPLANTSVIAYVDRETVEDNVIFYQKEMPARGYTLSADHAKLKDITEKMGTNINVMIFAREGEEVTISVSPVDDSSLTRVHITRVRGKGR
ncbi:hypothetical protein KKD52_17270 [Myxococcota bacterium]|nr:hypothetical protein [Myxococcota bacterium]MBU1411705.1 hypothetical protein [Myxococcota bacterium]MBU1512106.1 hypothetical protein [Myxococcota bacterium]